MYKDSYTSASNITSAQIESGSSATSHVPYSNVCPITGRTDATIWDDSKYGGMIVWNQQINKKTINYTSENLDVASQNDGKWTATIRGSISASVNITTMRGGAFPVGHKVLYLSGNDTVQVRYKTPNNIVTPKIVNIPSTWTNTSYNVVLDYPEGTTGTFDLYPVAFDLTQMFGSTIANYIYSLEQANAGEGVAWFRKLFPDIFYDFDSGTTACVSAINGDPYSSCHIDFPSEAGTVYGGTLDVMNGILTVDRVVLSFLATGKQGNFFYTTLSAQSSPDIAGLNSGLICDRFSVVSNIVDSRTNEGITAYANGIIRWVDPLYIGNTWQEYNAAMGSDRITIVYRLAEPQTYQLTPTQIEALSGANNIWADCGNIVSVVYQADTDTYADKHLPNDTAAAAADGKTHIWIRIDDDTPSGRMSFPLYWSQSVSRGVSVNWGDGTASQTYDGTGADTHTHTYARPGDYEITLNVTDGTISFDGTSTTSGFSLYGSRATASSYNRARILCAVIGNNVDKVGNYMFENAYSVKYVTIPSGVTSIGTEAFNRCHSLTDVYIPNGVTSIGASAFYYCYAMESVRIPDSVSSIGDEAFNNCFALKSVRLPNSLTSIGQSVFHGCYSLTSVEIPYGVLVIGSSAFGGCYGLTSVTIPASVISIGSGAFSNCYGVSEYHMRSQTPPTLTSSDTFGNMASDCVIYVPYSSNHSILNAYKAATNWSVYASKMQEEAQA